MKVPEKLFEISLSDLGDDKIFPFHLYVYNPQSDSYSLFLVANSPLDDEKEEFLKFVVEKGGDIAVDFKQKRTFLHQMELEEKDIPSLQERQLTDIEIKRIEKLKAFTKAKKEQQEGSNDEGIKSYDLKSGLNDCLKADNFITMIMEAQAEIELFEVTISHTVSLATYFAENLLTEDNMTNRIVAVSYYLAKNLGFKDQETLADLVCAAFLCHIGYTQLDYSLSHEPELNLSEKKKNKIKKHPGYTGHLITKSGVELSDRCKNIIFQHHERYDGSGYPSQKNGEFIDILALTLGSVSHIFEYSSGKITGSPLPLESVINRMKNKTFSAGLEFEFGDKIYENIISLLTFEKSSTEVA